MRIAIELDNIVRDNNAQALKYYWKGYDNNFDEDVDLGCSDLLSMLPFKSNKARKEFREIDYPYELFGCAKTTQKNLHVEMEDWMESNEDIEVILFHDYNYITLEALPEVIEYLKDDNYVLLPLFYESRMVNK